MRGNQLVTRVGPLEQSLDELLNAAYADGRADQLLEDVARLRLVDKEAGASHTYFAQAALVLLEKQ